MMYPELPFSYLSDDSTPTSLRSCWLFELSIPLNGLRRSRACASYGHGRIGDHPLANDFSDTSFAPTSFLQAVLLPLGRRKGQRPHPQVRFKIENQLYNHTLFLVGDPAEQVGVNRSVR
jgi:hypothetical protein